jgi:VanZ family protein
VDWLMHAAAHVLLYFILAFMISGSLGIQSQSVKTWLAVFAAAGYGLTDELHQSFVPTWEASVFDLALNLVGAIAGGLTYVAFERLRAHFTESFSNS